MVFNSPLLLTAPQDVPIHRSDRTQLPVETTQLTQSVGIPESERARWRRAINAPIWRQHIETATLSGF